jgi:hypothetical protein
VQGPHSGHLIGPMFEDADVAEPIIMGMLPERRAGRRPSSVIRWKWMRRTNG